MSGGKGGEQTQEIPKWLEQAGQRNVDRAEIAAKMGYAPYFGPAIAAVNPTERQAAANAVSGASAFGLADPSMDVYAGMPDTVSAGGVEGYATAPVMLSAIEQLQERAPGYMQGYNQLFESHLPPGAEGGYYFDPNNPSHVEAQQSQMDYMPMNIFQMAEMYRNGGFR